jgi:HD-GYP domain-containing protein (c-di-GMP phosphodiesterase class II)
LGTVKRPVRNADSSEDVASVDQPTLGIPETLVERRRRARALTPAVREAVVATAGAAVFVGATVALNLASSAHRPFPLVATVVLVVAFSLTAQVRFEVGSGFAVPTQLVLVPMMIALPARVVPIAVAAGVLLGSLPEVVRRAVAPSRLAHVPVNSLFVLGPATVLAVAGDPSPGWARWPVYLAALAAQIGCDFGAAASWSFAAYGVSPRAHLRETVLPWSVDLALAPLGLSIGLRVADQPAAILLVLPLVGLLGYFARERRQRLDHAIELSHAYRGTALLLGDVIEADDAYTGSHSRAVVELTLGVCDALGVDAATRRDAELAALLHDVGKVRIPAEVINKPGPLDEDERALMDTHTIEGERMLEQVGGLLGHVGHIVRSCHEHWDGGGYPDGLAGEAIPIAARVVACCDAYHAMTSDRPYRRALPVAQAKDELRRGRGTQFDPQVVDALLRVA